MPFKPGEHVRDHRRRFGVPYTHQAIKVDEEQVVQFGGSTANKGAMGIEYAPYEHFALGRKVDVVHHSGENPELSVRRARWLVSCPPPRGYNGIGFNCEHVARWCATGWETESLQIRHRLFGGKYVFVGLPLMFWLAITQRTERKLPLWAWLPIGANLAASLVIKFLYDSEIRYFNQHIRDHCPPELRGNIRPG